MSYQTKKWMTIAESAKYKECSLRTMTALVKRFADILKTRLSDGKVLDSRKSLGAIMPITLWLTVTDLMFLFGADRKRVPMACVRLKGKATRERMLGR